MGIASYTRLSSHCGVMLAAQLMELDVVGALAGRKSELMPPTWAFRLSNLGRSSWRAATSRVQVGVNAPMNPKSTTFFLPTS